METSPFKRQISPVANMERKKISEVQTACGEKSLRGRGCEMSFVS